MPRPNHLPDFREPPLDEVVLGVQFAPIPTYTSVYAEKIWNLFRKVYPKVEEQLLLPPQFETFGGANLQPSFKFQVGVPPVGSRLWFVSEDENSLLQFQPDRFLTNWRKRPNLQAYPRFEGLAGTFSDNLKVLAQCLRSDFSYEIDINQAEVVYINLIPVEDLSQAGKWFSLWSGGLLNIEALNTSFTEVIVDANGKPFARLIHEIQSVFTVDGQHKAFSLTLTFRGKPNGTDIEAAMEFLSAGRDAIVTRFGEITTGEAHTFWGRQE